MEPENPGKEIAMAMADGMGRQGADRIADAIGGLFPFWGLKRRAVNAYVSDIERSSLPPEVKMFAIANVKKTFREIKNQSAIIDVAYDSICNKHNISPESLSDVDSELVLRLVDAGKFVSDEELQLLWGNVLAGEFEQLGSTPKSIIRILSELSKEEAATFSNLGSLGVDILADTGSDIEYIGFDFMINGTGRYLRQINIDDEILQELDHHGLINFNNAEYARPLHHTRFPYIHIVSETHVMTVINNTNDFPVGCILLTKAGKCLLRFAPRRYNKHHMAAIKFYLEREGFKVSENPGIRITEVREGETHMEYSFERQSTAPLQTQE